jgi:hypothetical protein
MGVYRVSPGDATATDALREFACLHLWVLWKLLERGGKPTKVPFSPIDQRNAAANDPATWGTRTEAERLVADYSGVGIMLAPLDEGRHLGGIDLDACIDDEGNVAPWAGEIVELLNSYTEISPSGHGLKIFFLHDPRATLAEGVRWRAAVRQPAPHGGKEPGIEFYLDRRYFTVTDQTFGNFGTVRLIDLDTLCAVQAKMESFADKPKAPTNHPRRHDDDQQRIIDAIARMPNHDLHWEEWNTLGMAIYAATGGSAQGYAAFLGWSTKSGKFDQRACDERWQHWHTSPPDQLTAGTIFHHAEGENRTQAKSNGAAIENAADVENAAKPPNPNGNDEADADQRGDGGGRGPKQADILIGLTQSAELFHTPDGIGFADIVVNGHRETWPIRRKGFKHWLTRRFFQTTGGAPNSEALQSALNVIEAKAHFDAPEREVYIRVGGLDGRLYLDLGDDTWRAIEIDATGWRIIDQPPVRFRRAAGMLPLPAPQPGGSIERLRIFLNVASDSDFVLVVSFILACLRNRGPYPVLVLSGEQGSAKSTFSAIVRALLDPNTAPLRALPREDRDLFIAASNAHVLVFDNVSGLPPWISDTLCRLATGGGFAVRQLYTDQDEVLFDAARPVILNGIEDIVTRPDLADRAVLLTLKPIPEERRRPEGELWAAFETDRPRILGLLLDAVVEGLKRLPDIHLPKLPRMADFALWASACETTFWPAGTFWAAYCGNRDEAIEGVIEADPIANAVRALMSTRTEWTGTASALLGALAQEVTERVAKAKTWPDTPRALSNRLRRAMTFLRTIGIEIGFEREGDRARTRIIRITRVFQALDSRAPENVGAQPSASSASSASAPKSSSANRSAVPDLRTVPNGADSQGNKVAETNPLKRSGEDGADAADANGPPQSAPGKKGWSTTL